MPTVSMTLEEYLNLIESLSATMGTSPMSTTRALEMAGIGPTIMSDPSQMMTAPVRKKRKTRYQTAYKKAFRKAQSKYKKKNGEWKKDGFKKAVREAHRDARRALER